jgi:hypothetical protein
MQISHRLILLLFVGYGCSHISAEELPDKPAKPDFKIESTKITRLDVVESAPMEGLPVVHGKITLKMHNVAEPKLQESPVSESPSAPEPSADLPTEVAETQIASVSATVYDRSRTLLTCYTGAAAGNPVTVWSNVDFNYFSGVAMLDAKGADGKLRSYHLLMGIGNEVTIISKKRAASAGEESPTPQIPKLPDGEPAFVITSANPDPASLKLIEDLHTLYRNEGTRMVREYIAREKAEEKRRKYLIANPPKPKDVTIHFWKRN